MIMNFGELFEKNGMLFTECAVIERVARETAVELDRYLLNAGLVYNESGKKILEKIYRQYIDIGMFHELPMIVVTPTWRANRERIESSSYHDRNVNADCFAFLNGIRSSYKTFEKNIFIGGLIGCRGDAYKPAEGLSSDAAYEFHGYQIQALNDAGVDFLIAETLPALPEAIGISRSMAESGKNYVISFVIRSDGNLLDGNSLNEAITKIDSAVYPKPLFYMVNCVHPAILEGALAADKNKTETVRGRLFGIRANTSSRSPEELDKSNKLCADDPAEFFASMKRLHLQYGLKIFGGCCGTDDTHLRKMIDMFLATSQVNQAF